MTLVTEPAARAVPLMLEDVARLRATGNPQVDETDIDAIVEAFPGWSFWLPSTGEFILVQPWRNRRDLPQVRVLWSFTADAVLLDAASKAARARGAACLVMLDPGERRRPQFYVQHGFRRVEMIRTYEHHAPERLLGLVRDGELTFRRVRTVHDPLVAEIERVDNAAFPWFWMNTRDEFAQYLDFPGVELWAVQRDGEVIAYSGLTQFHHWAHLDRIAVLPGVQGRGVGRQVLGHAARRMLAEGAIRIALSTQSGNQRSRHLYETLGFRHTRQADYDVHGMIFDVDRVYAPAPTR